MKKENEAFRAGYHRKEIKCWVKGFIKDRIGLGGTIKIL